LLISVQKYISITTKLLSVKKKNDSNFITVECLLAFDKDKKVLNLMGDPNQVLSYITSKAKNY
jgi:hypothetical protein